MAPTFYACFKQNMDSMGLPAPESIFGTLSSAITGTNAILSQIDKFGKAVTAAELVSAGTRLEQLGVIGACSAAYYVGAVIGSIAVATGRSVSGGVIIADVMFTAEKYHLNRPWLAESLLRRR